MSKNNRVQQKGALRRFFAIDLAKRESQLCVTDANGDILEERRFPTTPAKLEEIAAQLTKHDTVCFEMTTNSFAIARLFNEFSPAKVLVSNPMKTKLIASARVKTDKIDARVLAELARVGFLPDVWLPDEACESLRRLVSRRTNLVRRRTAVKNDVHSILHRNLVEYERPSLFSSESSFKSLDISRSLVDYYETRSPNPALDFIERSASALEVSVAELLGSEPNASRSKPGPQSQLQSKFEQVKLLPREKEKFIIQFLDTVLDNQQKQKA